MATSLDRRLANGIHKWVVSGARELGFPEPTRYRDTDGDTKKGARWYRGPDELGGSSIVHAGRVLLRFASSSESEAFWKANISNSTAREAFLAQQRLPEIESTDAAPVESRDAMEDWFTRNVGAAQSYPRDRLLALALTAESTSRMRETRSSVYVRSPAIAAFVKQEAGGVCDLCGSDAPFVDRFGQPYLESHHVRWLARGGADAIANAVALCPNCHRRVHVLDDFADKRRLKAHVAARRERSHA